MNNTLNILDLVLNVEALWLEAADMDELCVGGTGV